MGCEAALVRSYLPGGVVLRLILVNSGPLEEKLRRERARYEAERARRRRIEVHGGGESKEVGQGSRPNSGS